MTWKVQLAGDVGDFAELTKVAGDFACCVSYDGTDYLLESDGFEQADNAQGVRDRAKHIVSMLNGATRLQLNAIQPVSVGAVYRYGVDGIRMETYACPEPVAIQCRVNPVGVTMTHSDGTIQRFHPADPIPQWMRLALSNDPTNRVSEVLQYLSLRPLEIRTLYKIYEAIELDLGGKNTIASKGWATKPSIKLFRRTANSYEAAGLNARHAQRGWQPPTEPMSISEAQALINAIVRAWLKSKNTT